MFPKDAPIFGGSLIETEIHFASFVQQEVLAYSTLEVAVIMGADPDYSRLVPTMSPYFPILIQEVDAVVR
jgi:hypothetical protein